MRLENEKNHEKPKASAGSTPALQKNILATVAYYDVMDYPLTAFEIWKYLIRTNDHQLTIYDESNNFSLSNVIDVLSKDKLQKFIEEYRGFYFLKGRKDLVEERLKRNKIAGKKLKKLQKIVWILRFVPYVRMAGITGRLAKKNTEPKSDWDLLVVLKDGKIWTGRFLVTLAIHMLGKRRHGTKIKDRICLNHFITEKCSVGIKDLFSASEYFFMLPLFDLGIFEKFRIRNSWIKNYKVNFHLEPANSTKLIKDAKMSRAFRGALEKLFSAAWIENILKKYQFAKIERNPKTQKNTGLIIYTDEEMAFWPDFQNQGPDVFEKFKKRIDSLV